MGDLGVNVAGRAEYSPSAIDSIGSTWTRCVAYSDVDITDWFRDVRSHGLKALLVLARESIGNDPMLWAGAIDRYAERYIGLVDAWQIGNEADGTGESSWTQSPAELSGLLKVARAVLGKGSYLVAAGMVSGQPGWLNNVELKHVDAIAAHPYAKWPDTAELSTMLNGYATYGRDLWVTEYHARTLGMAAYLKQDRRVSKALAFCYSDGMVPGFGLIENAAALADYTLAAGAPPVVPPGPVTPPVGPPASAQPGFNVGQGIRDLCAARGWTVASHEDYTQASHSETLVLTPDGPRVASYWHAAKQLYVGPTLEVIP